MTSILLAQRFAATTTLAGASALLGIALAQAQTASPGTANSGATALQTLVVQGGGAIEGAEGVVETDGYVAKSGRTATKTDTPVAETPQSMSTVSRKQLEDRKPQNLSEAVSYTPGVRIGQYGAEPRFDAFKVRGIDLTYTGIFRDGLRQISSPNGLFRLEPYGVEAISILRGPAASIYGASSSGGIVDIISKRPTEEQFREVEMQYGSYGRVQGAFDVSGPLDPENTVLYRITGLARDARSEISAIKDDRLFIAPAFTWQPDEGTKFTLLGEYMDSTTGGTWGYINNYGPAGSIGATPVYGGDARFNDFDQEQARIGYELEHELSDNVTLYHKLRFSDLSTQQEWVFADFPGMVKEDNSGVASDNYLKTDFETGALDHQLITGIDYSYMKYKSLQGSGPDLFTDSFTYVPELTYKETQRQNSVGIYAQDQIEFGAWRLMAGLRHDWLNSEFTTDSPAGFSHYSRDDSETTGRIGLGYVTQWNVMPYVSYGTSFVANPGVILSTGGVSEQAEPTMGEQYEIGVKYALPDHNALITASLFNIDQENASVWETSSGTNLLRQLDLRSRGFELEASASLDNGLSLIAAYSYNDVKITKLTAETVGNQLNSTPYHTFSLWADYEFQSGMLEGLGMGAGVRYLGSSFGDNQHTPVLDNEARTFVDASLRYDLGKLNPSMDGVRLQVNATNLLDEVKQICTTGFCYFDEGRKVVGSLRYRF
ncbi:TonB-dependent siderophore receptor [Sinorhizobium americanum]|uniref:Iron complex outermembrane receptor protein n=1 Tax=Sinorhizobium americanum TaxID=194963 RepID=A0A4R2BU14_9HYPH|nr:TonB-dependent siderophore receptor [Sinorhizobium americanum]TCN29454.1 iron complex outermembrane receptor protein [Sinorhizobium americanum]